MSYYVTLPQKQNTMLNTFFFIKTLWKEEKRRKQNKFSLRKLENAQV